MLVFVGRAGRVGGWLVAFGVRLRRGFLRRAGLSREFFPLRHEAENVVFAQAAGLGPLEFLVP